MEVLRHLPLDIAYKSRFRFRHQGILDLFSIGLYLSSCWSFVPIRTAWKFDEEHEEGVDPIILGKQFRGWGSYGWNSPMNDFQLHFDRDCADNSFVWWKNELRIWRGAWHGEYISKNVKKRLRHFRLEFTNQRCPVEIRSIECWSVAVMRKRICPKSLWVVEGGGFILKYVKRQNSVAEAFSVWVCLAACWSMASMMMEKLDRKNLWGAERLRKGDGDFIPRNGVRRRK